MKNKIFNGLEVREVTDKDTELPAHLVGAYGLVDKKTDKWMPKCFSRKSENIQDMHKEISSVLSSPVEEIIHLSSFSWGWDHDNYVPSMALNLWISINPGVIDTMKLTLEEYQKNRVAKDKKKLKKARMLAKQEKLANPDKKRGRPKKNSGAISMAAPNISRASGVKRGRGRPRKLDTMSVSPTVSGGQQILEKRGRGRPRKAS